MLATELTHWVNTNNSIEMQLKSAPICLKFLQTQPQEQIIPHKVPGKSWEVIGEDIFQIQDKHVLCVIDYFNKFPIIR